MHIRTAVTLAAMVVLTLSACHGSHSSPSRADRGAAMCGGERPAKPGGGRYHCTFSDDFSHSTLDPSKWIVATTAQGGFTTGTIATAKDCYVDRPPNVSVSRGQLHLTSRVEASPLVCHSPLGDFTTSQTGGSVASFGKFAQTYGRFEFRARFPSTKTPGVDSALWLYPQAPAYGAWPISGEIDVAERFADGAADHILPSVHYAGENPSASTGRQCVVPHADAEFHTYAVNWTSTAMYFYYDDQLCHQHSWTPVAPLVAPQPFDQPFDLVMTQTGGAGAPVETTITMDVDWVRAWN